jgi:transcription initiation factor IIE alpha subunit
MVPAEPGPPFSFRNYYQCPYDQTKWRDDWHCTCNDRCPVCDREIEAYFSEDIGILS